MSTGSKASKFLENLLGVSQNETAPTGVQGILQTKDYNEFIILSDVGDRLHSFMGSKLANKCLPGDHVSWNGTHCVLELRDEHPRIVGTLELTNKSRYGLTSRGIPIYLFTPYNKRYPHFIVGCSEKDVSKNRIGIIKFDTWEQSSTFPRGLLQQLLGVSGDFEAEKQALICQASPWKYPKFDYKATPKNDAPREQITGYTFNIDPEGCKDVDDVLTFEKVGNCWKVIITISDVATFVEDGSPVDIMASLIGQTLYDTTGSVLRPMLPAEFSENQCSLIPGKESFGISLEFKWDGIKIKDIRWFESSLKTDKSYTYEEFQTSESPFKAPLQAIASYLAKEAVSDSHKWIEQMMLFYNTEAGKLLKEANMGILRRHSAPNLEKLARYQIHLPDLKMLAYSSAEYCLAEEEDTKHYGLETNTYAHTSSPIRRYADLVNQRILKLIIRGKQERYIVPQAMYDMNLREKAIKAFARDSDFLTAISTGQNEFKGIILEKIAKENGFIKVKIYVPQWKRSISTTYKALSDNKVLSRDESREIDVTDYREVNIKCTFNLNSRNWKERVIFNIY